MEPDRIYASKADNYIPDEEYDAFFAAVVDCGFAKGVEVITVTQTEVIGWTEEELQLFQRLMMEKATHHMNTVVEAQHIQDFSRNVLQVRISHDVPCITTLGSDGAAEDTHSYPRGERLRNVFGEPTGDFFDKESWKSAYETDAIHAARYMYNQYGDIISPNRGFGSLFDGMI